MNPSLEVRFGKLVDITGPVRKWGDISIVAANVELIGTMFTPSHRLEEYVRTHSIPSEVVSLVKPGQDAAWVRGRVERLFLVPPSREDERPEKSCLYASFLAVVPEADGRLVGIPFDCTDYYGRTNLHFSQERPPDSVCDQIAEAIWSLLLQDPFDVPDYEDTMFHLGTGNWVRFGIEAGEPFMEEREER